MELYYSPNYGCSFWPKQLGFFQSKKVQQIFEKENEKFLHIFFGDYTHETTTFCVIITTVDTTRCLAESLKKHF